MMGNNWTDYENILRVRDKMFSELQDRGIVPEKDRTAQDSDSSVSFTFKINNQTFTLKIYMAFGEFLPQVVISRPMVPYYGSIYKYTSSNQLDKGNWLEFIDTVSNLPLSFLPDNAGVDKLVEYLNTGINLDDDTKGHFKFRSDVHLYYDENNKPFQCIYGKLNLSDRRLLEISIHYYSDSEMKCHFSRYFDNPNSKITYSFAVFKTEKNLLTSYIYWALSVMEI